MDAGLAPVLPPREDLGLGHPAPDESQDLRRRLAIEVEPAPDVVAVGDEDLQPEVEVAPPLADEPRLPPQPPREVTEHRFGVVDRKERVGRRSRQPAAGRAMHEPIPPEGSSRQTGVGRLLVGLENDAAQAPQQISSPAEGPLQGSPRSIAPADKTRLVLGDRSCSSRGALPPRPDGRRLGPDDEATLRLDQDRDTQRSGVPPLFVGLDLVELESRALPERPAQVEVQTPEVAGDLAELELGAAQAQAQVARALAQAEARGERLEEARIEIGPVVAVVHAEGLAGKGPQAAV